MWGYPMPKHTLVRAMMLTLFGICIMVATPVAEAQVESSSWQTIGNTPGTGGIAQAVQGYGDFLLVARQTSTQARSDMWLYQLTEAGGQQLRFVGNLLTPPIRFEAGLSLAWDGTRFIYALIGANYNTRNRTGFLRFDTCLNQAQSCANSWQFLENTPAEQGPGNALTFARAGNQEYLYAFLGSSSAERSGASNIFARYNVSTASWEQLSHPPAWDCTDDGAALEWDRGGFVYALNGSDCNDRATTKVSRYSVSTSAGNWQAVPAIPKAVDNGGSLVYDNNGGIFALSGAGVSLPAGTGEDAFRFNTQTQQWETLAELPCPVGGFSGNRLALVGQEILAWQGHQNFASCGGSAIMRYQP